MELQEVKTEFMKACARRMADDVTDAIAEVVAVRPRWWFRVVDVAADYVEDREGGDRFTLTAVVDVSYRGGLATSTCLRFGCRSEYVEALHADVDARADRLALEWARDRRTAAGAVTVNLFADPEINSDELLSAVAYGLTQRDCKPGTSRVAEGLNGILTRAAWCSVDGMRLERVAEGAYRFVPDEDDAVTGGADGGGRE